MVVLMGSRSTCHQQSTSVTLVSTVCACQKSVVSSAHRKGFLGGVELLTRGHLLDATFPATTKWRNQRIPV